MLMTSGIIYGIISGNSDPDLAPLIFGSGLLAWTFDDEFIEAFKNY